MRLSVLGVTAAALGLSALLLGLWPKPAASLSLPTPTAALLRDVSVPLARATSPSGAPYVRLAFPSATSNHKTPYLVLIVLDGARPDYFQVQGIPHLRALMRNGTQFTNAWAGILESETPSGHASIDTGSDPTGSGILSFAWAGNDNTTVNLFDPSKIRDGSMERIIKGAPSPSIAELVHRRDPTAKIVALGGHKYYANDALGGPDADAIMYYMGTPDGRFAPVGQPGHMPPASVLSAPGLVASKTSLPLGAEDHLAMKLGMASFKHMHERVMLVNVPEFDWPLGHNYGGSRDPAGVQSLMQGFDADLGKLEDLYRKAGVLDRTVFVITADHGLAPIYYTVSKSIVDRAIARSGTSVISDAYHTAGYVWLKKPAKAPLAASYVAQIRNPYIQSVYYKTPWGKGYRYVRASAANRFYASGADAANHYLLHSFQGPNAPNLVVFFTQDAASLPGGESVWKGDHGGADWQSQHLPLLFAGPGVRRGYVSAQPARLMDIAPTALTLMGVPHQGMQGIPLASAISSATAAQWKTEWAVGKQLRPVIRALQAEAWQEVAHRR